VNEPERYGTCSDGNGHWGIEDDGKVILSGLVSHDACDAVMDILDERDALKAEVERLTKAGDAMAGVIGLPVNSVQSSALIENWNAAKEGKGQP
jgi:hypothetical protein